MCRSIPSRSEYEVWADDLDALLKQFDMAPAIIGGSSSGARLALTFALRHPQSVRALTLWRVTGGGFAVKRLAERYYDQYIRLAGEGGMAAVCAEEHFAELHPQPAVQPRAADGHRSEGVHRHHAVRGGRRSWPAPSCR